MSCVTASMVDGRLPRGKDKILYFLIEEDGEPFDLTGHTIALRLSASWTYGEPVVEKAGEIHGDPGSGRVRFTFVPDDTDGLMARSYDAGVYVKEDGTELEWTAFFGKIAVVPTSPEEVAE